MEADLRRRLARPGPKRILALDGGGVRGVISLGFLARIERLLRRRHGDPALRLCDYFDLVGGTSTGSIIASAIAIGMEVEEIRASYLELATRVFGRRRWRWWEARFDEGPLLEALERAFQDRTLGDASLRTGLCIVVKRVDTMSTWPLLNHPEGRFYEQNRSILLRDAIRASTAAPTTFRPHTAEVAKGEAGVFIDGAVSTALNPALQLFCVATLSGFPFHWKTGADALLLVSVGTGTWHPDLDPARLAKSRLWNWAVHVPQIMLHDGLWQNQLILQYLSDTKTPWPIDAEIGDLSEDLLGGTPALEYVRYDVVLEEAPLRSLGLSDLCGSLEALRDMTNAKACRDFDRVGVGASERYVEEEHFPRSFDRATEVTT